MSQLIRTHIRRIIPQGSATAETIISGNYYFSDFTLPPFQDRIVPIGKGYSANVGALEAMDAFFKQNAPSHFEENHNSFEVIRAIADGTFDMRNDHANLAIPSAMLFGACDPENAVKLLLSNSLFEQAGDTRCRFVIGEGLKAAFVNLNPGSDLYKAALHRMLQLTEITQYSFSFNKDTKGITRTEATEFQPHAEEGKRIVISHHSIEEQLVDIEPPQRLIALRRSFVVDKNILDYADQTWPRKESKDASTFDSLKSIIEGRFSLKNDNWLEFAQALNRFATFDPIHANRYLLAAAPAFSNMDDYLYTISFAHALSTTLRGLSPDTPDHHKTLLQIFRYAKDCVSENIIASADLVLDAAIAETKLHSHSAVKGKNVLFGVEEFLFAQSQDVKDVQNGNPIVATEAHLIALNVARSGQVMSLARSDVLTGNLGLPAELKLGETEIMKRHGNHAEVQEVIRDREALLLRADDLLQQPRQPFSQYLSSAIHRLDSRVQGLEY